MDELSTLIIYYKMLWLVFLVTMTFSVRNPSIHFLTLSIEVNEFYIVFVLPLQMK